jgi:hypothetical protein
MVPTSPSITTSATGTTFTAGSPGSFGFTSSGQPTPTISDNGATLPTGVTFTDSGNGGASLSGTPAIGTGGVYPITLTAANGENPPASEKFDLTVVPVPIVTSPTSAGFTVGQPGTFTVTTSGFQGTSPTISDGSGTLPSGVTFTNNGNGTATLSGTPATGTGGSYPLTLTASDGSAPPIHSALTLKWGRPVMSW